MRSLGTRLDQLQGDAALGPVVLDPHLPLVDVDADHDAVRAGPAGVQCALLTLLGVAQHVFPVILK